MGKKIEIAYFSAEIGISASIPTYSGGLGVLAGDHIKAAGDEGINLGAITLLYKEGYFKQRLENVFEQADDLKEITRDLKNNEGESLEIIDEAILWLGIVEIRANELAHPVVIDECIRLAKKFSNPNSYKFVNAKLDDWLKTNQTDWLKKGS